MDMESAAIIGAQFCAPYTIDLAFTIKAPGVKRGHLAATDINGIVLFKVESSSWSLKLRNSRLMVDADGNPLVSMKEKFRSTHGRRQVFKGNSSDPKDLLFSVKRTSVLQFRTELDVFLASNTKEKISKEHKATKLSVGKHAFGVPISPNIDSCFIAALAMFHDELYQEAMAAAIGSSVGAAARVTASFAC